MVNLQDTCCLDISFDPDSNSLLFNDQVTPTESRKIMLKNLTPALLNKNLTYPRQVYEEYIQVSHIEDVEIMQKGFYYDLICLPSGLLGVEFIKSHVYYSPLSDDRISTLVEVHLGTLTVIMQKNKPRGEYDFHTEVDEGLLVTLRRGEKLAIPQGYFYTFINTEESPAVFVRMHRGHDIIDYSLIQKERGLAYYAIRKNARLEVVLNPVYRGIPKIKKIKPENTLTPFSIDSTRSLYTQLREDIGRFAEIIIEAHI